MKIDYLNIILLGIADENSKTHLSQYFYREYKEALKKDFSKSEFFNGCTTVVESLEYEIKQKYFDRKKELLLIKRVAEEKTIKYDKDNGESIEDRRKSTIKNCEKELNVLSVENFTLPVRSSLMNCSSLCYSDLQEIKHSLSVAYRKLSYGDKPFPADDGRTKKLIRERIENVDKEGWGYFFQVEEDYNCFTDILINFFEYKEYSLPVNPFKFKQNSKTKLASVLGDIHTELSEIKLVDNCKFFEILTSCVNHFSNDDRQKIYNALQR